jgi:hypothetical protein
MTGKECKGEDCGIPNRCTRVVPKWLVALDNAPTITMFFVGAAMLWLIWWPLSIMFLAYTLSSIVLFWGIICPHCHHFDTTACPCGYGVAAPKFFKRRKDKDFKKVFKKNIAIMYPNWAMPFLTGIYLLWASPTALVLGLFLAFCIIGFGLIPGISKFVGCKGCEIKDQCPWMAKESRRDLDHFDLEV